MLFEQRDTCRIALGKLNIDRTADRVGQRIDSFIVPDRDLCSVLRSRCCHQLQIVCKTRQQYTVGRCTALVRCIQLCLELISSLLKHLRLQNDLQLACQRIDRHHKSAVIVKGNGCGTGGLTERLDHLDRYVDRQRRCGICIRDQHQRHLAVCPLGSMCSSLCVSDLHRCVRSVHHGRSHTVRHACKGNTAHILLQVRRIRILLVCRQLKGQRTLRKALVREVHDELVFQRRLRYCKSTCITAHFLKRAQRNFIAATLCVPIAVIRFVYHNHGSTRGQRLVKPQSQIFVYRRIIEVDLKIRGERGILGHRGCRIADRTKVLVGGYVRIHRRSLLGTRKGDIDLSRISFRECTYDVRKSIRINGSGEVLCKSLAIRHIQRRTAL